VSHGALSAALAHPFPGLVALAKPAGYEVGVAALIVMTGPVAVRVGKLLAAVPPIAVGGQAEYEASWAVAVMVPAPAPPVIQGASVGAGFEETRTPALERSEGQMPCAARGLRGM
jgi:hypothetical protein